MEINKINENTYFKTELGSIISWYELKTSVEVCYGNRWNYIYNDFNIYISGLINEGYIKVKPVTLKQGYDYALNKGDKIKAIRLYWKLKNESGEYYSLADAKKHVEKILEKRNKIWSLEHTNTNIRLEEVKEGLNFLDNYKGE